MWSAIETSSSVDLFGRYANWAGRLVSLGTGQLAVVPFVVCNSLQALPHKTSVGAGKVRFNLSPISALCLFEGLSEGIAGFLKSFRGRVQHLECGSSTL